MNACRVAGAGGLTGLLGFAVWETIARARIMPYAPDEIINLAAVLRFMRSGDYTILDVPFNPAISSGLAATWLHGVTMLAGADLFLARAIVGLTQLALLVVLGVAALRQRDVSTWDASLIVAGAWIAFLPVLGHEGRIVSPGELWGAIWLLLGVVLAGRHPAAAVVAAGVAAWLGKIIYLPFAAALALAIGLAHGGRRNTVRLALCFLAPLAAWMAVIALRYDLATLLGWCVAHIAFVLVHATGIPIDVAHWPVLPGWRFEARWQATSMLTGDAASIVRALAPIGLALGVRAMHAFLSHRGTIAALQQTRMSYDVMLSVVVAHAIWFLAFDPTQWARHLLPASYIATGLTIAGLVDIALASSAPGSGQGHTTAAQRRRGVACAVLFGAAAAYGMWFTWHDGQVEPWRLSYARTCTAATNVMTPPCMQAQAVFAMARFTHEDCGYPDRNLDQDCLRRKSDAYVQRALANVGAGLENGAAIAGYQLILLQYWAHASAAEFVEEVAPALCGEHHTELRAFLNDAGFDARRWAEICSRAG